MKALVLGGAGFLGSWIVKQLSAQHVEVVVVCRSPKVAQELPRNGTRYVLGDCSDPVLLQKAMKGCDAVFHTAGYYPLFSVERNAQAQRALSELRNVLHAAQVSDVSRFIFTSSPMVLVEDPQAFQRCTYHFIKRLLHEEVLRWTNQGLPSVLVIPGACFGPDDRKPTTGRLILEIAQRRLRFVLAGKMNAVDARDVAIGQVEMLHRGTIGSCYQLGNWNCTLSEFASLVARVAQVPAPCLTVPYPLVRAAAGIVELIQYRAGLRVPLFPQSGLDQIHYGTYLDSSEAVRELGFTMRPIEETVRETVEYFQRERRISN